MPQVNRAVQRNVHKARRVGSKARALQPPHVRQLAARGADASDRLRHRLDRDRHVKGIGMDERGLVAHDGDVAAPEQEIAAREVGEIIRRQCLAATCTRPEQSMPRLVLPPQR